MSGSTDEVPESSTEVPEAPAAAPEAAEEREIDVAAVTGAVEPAGDSDGTVAAAIDLAPPKPLSWAQRAAKSCPATSAAPVLAYGAPADSSESSSGAPASSSTAVPKVRDSILDYFSIMAAHKMSSRGEGIGDPEAEPELPEELRKFRGCLDSGGVPATAGSTYIRLGLRNDANNCYLNSVVQALLPCSALLWVLRRCSVDDASRPFHSCLVRLCKEFHTRSSHGEVLNAIALPQVRTILANWQRLGAQQDAGELLFHLLSGLHEESKWKAIALEEDEPSDGVDLAAGDEAASTPSGGAWAHVVKTSRRQAEVRSAGLHEDSPITRIFGGLLQSGIRANSAKADSVTLEPFNHLDLDIAEPSVSSVRQALQAYCLAESVSGVQGTRQMQFRLLPKVLILCLKRFTYNRMKGTSQKVKKSIKYEEKLTIDPAWLVDGVQVPDYHITAVVCHHGENVNRGHYTAMVRYNAEWYCYDDTVIRRVEGREVAAQQDGAYLLIYQARGTVDLRP